MTLAALASSREVCFLVAGREKSEALRKVFAAPAGGSDRFPASRVSSRGTVWWYIDRDAAVGLRGELRNLGNLADRSAVRSPVPRPVA
jgi:6-phosphogluconolactonase/glucosamine-6-phosphate isomerase/deaminase